MKVRKSTAYRHFLDRFQQKSSDRDVATLKMKSKLKQSSQDLDSSILHKFKIRVDKGERKLLKKAYKRWANGIINQREIEYDHYFEEHKEYIKRISQLEIVKSYNPSNISITLKMLDNRSLEAFASPIPGNENLTDKEYYIVYDRKIINTFDLISVSMPHLLLEQKVEAGDMLRIINFEELLYSNRDIIKFISHSISSIRDQHIYTLENPPGNGKIRVLTYESCAVFLFAHEISHILLGHLEKPDDSNFDQEVEADKLTAEIMLEYGQKHLNPLCRSMITPPIALTFFDYINKILESSDQTSETHPTTEMRLKIFSDKIKEKHMSNEPMYGAAVLSLLLCRMSLGIDAEYDKIKASRIGEI